MVRVKSLNSIGEVFRKIQEKNKIVVRTGTIKVEVRADDLEFVI
jgi:dsDNA-specific endonuclease/ATPase MutS2